ALAAKLRAQGGPAGMDDKTVIAVIAYLQRLGVDMEAHVQAKARTTQAQAPAAPERATAPTNAVVQAPQGGNQ
ncbi:MAG: hypothetical protein SFX73_01525, partial [Kofleriaceae bacterium]|nr:hypothetical protein [Kofleriaceae bacterium]